jgi:hypothetical protein
MPLTQERLVRNSTQLTAIRDSVAVAGRLSDSIVHLGPFRLGIDGVLNWIPGIGELYSAAAAAFILGQGFRAGVPLASLLLCAALMGGRTLLTLIPLVGPLAADLFTAHRWSARIVVRAIDAKLSIGADDGPSVGAGPRFGWPAAAY